MIDNQNVVMLDIPLDIAQIESNVRVALAEDLGSGDITAELISVSKSAHARVIAREPAVVAGAVVGERRRLEIARSLDVLPSAGRRLG